MRSSRWWYSACIMCGLLSFAFATFLAPELAYADLIDICTQPGIRVTDVAYDTSADLTDSEDSFYQTVRSELSTNPLSDGEPVMQFPLTGVQRVNTTGYIDSYSTGSQWDVTSETLEYVHITTKSETSWSSVTNPLAYLVIDLFENPLPVGARLTFDGLQSYFTFTDTKYNWYRNLGADDFGWPIASGWQFSGDVVNVWAATSRYANRAVLCSYDSSMGFYEVPIQARYIYITFRMRTDWSVLDGSTSYRLAYMAPIHVYWQVIGNDTVSTNNTINQQTQDLKDTTGSGSIVGGVSDDAFELVDDLGFVSQTASFITGAYDAIMGSEQTASLTFPGLNIMGYTIIASQPVSFLGYLGSDIEETIKRGVTLVLFLLWVNGLRGMYRKMFLGEVEVEVSED